MSGNVVFFYDFGCVQAVSENSIYLQSQIHGNEIFGTRVLHRVIEQLNLLDEEAIKGFIRIAPAVNPEAWLNYMNTGEGGYELLSGLNWNRVFENWIVEKAVDLYNLNPLSGVLGVTEGLIADSRNYSQYESKLPLILIANSLGFKYVVDVHTPEYGIEHLYCQHFASMVPTFGIHNIVEYKSLEMKAFEECHIRLSQALHINCIPVTVELPAKPYSRRDEIDYWANQVLNEMHRLELIRMPHYKQIQDSFEEYRVGTIRDYYSHSGGAIAYEFTEGQAVNEGDTIATVLARKTNRLEIESIIAEKECLPISFRNRGVVKPGSWALRVLEARE
jgi:predicted deacylase